MQRVMVSFVSFGMMLGSLLAGAEGDTKAAALIKQARAALGGDSKLAKIQGLSATGTLAREMGDRQVTGELTIDVQLPDKICLLYTSPSPRDRQKSRMPSSA